ncbi:MAG: hypothetical protein U5L72_13790 [Bacteroidales bacterium]|nr:hypothetical protein [Bacteroidales bacterium]
MEILTVKRAYREGLESGRPGGEYAGESSVIALHESPFSLPAGGRYTSAFASIYQHDHPAATSMTDLDRLQELFREFSGSMAAGDVDGVTTTESGGLIAAESGNLAKAESGGNTKTESDGLTTAEFDGPPTTESDGMITAEGNLFNNPDLMPVDDLSESDLDNFFGSDRRHCESHEGRLLSFFCGENTHVMLRAKESLTDRPHGHIMQAATGFTPDGMVMSTTAFAFGVFNSHITQGNTNFNALLSVCNSQFNLSPESGQRIFAMIDGRFMLLGVPSAFEINLNSCRWIYKSGDYCFQVRTWTSVRTPQINLEFSVKSRSPTRLLITHDFDELNGWTVGPGRQGGEYVALPRRGSMIASRSPEARFTITVQGHDGADCLSLRR